MCTSFLVNLSLAKPSSNGRLIEPSQNGIPITKVPIKLFSDKSDSFESNVLRSLQTTKNLFAAQAKEYINRMEPSINAALPEYFVGSQYTCDWAIFRMSDLLQCDIRRNYESFEF